MTDIRSVLITGGAGFFGKACAAFLLRNNMADRICIYSRSEHSHADMRVQLKNDPRLRFFIGCVRDFDRLERAMHGVDLVIHAAALKRIEVGRYDAPQMTITNVMGAINVVEAARRAQVKRVVALSTDKAYQPQPGSAYGQSKALMETIILTANDSNGEVGPRFAACRYGNIAGSTGSIIPKWASMIRRGAKSVPVTSMEATRFFMRVDEAVELVLGTAAHMRGGEIAVPELPAYRVGDLVEAFGVKADVIGMPAWEKLHESMEEGKSSEFARRMSVDELREHIWAFTA